jgi:hypothetical protein
VPGSVVPLGMVTVPSVVPGMELSSVPGTVGTVLGRVVSTGRVVSIGVVMVAPVVWGSVLRSPVVVISSLLARQAVSNVIASTKIAVNVMIFFMILPPSLGLQSYYFPGKAKYTGIN